MAKSLADLDRLVEARATRLVHIHLAGCKPVRDAKRRAKLSAMRDAAFDRLVRAVEQRDREVDAHRKRMEEWKLCHWTRP